MIKRRNHRPKFKARVSMEAIRVLRILQEIAAQIADGPPLDRLSPR
jgi:hypothetical protein